MSIEEAIMGGIVFKGKKDKPKEEEKVKTKAKKANVYSWSAWFGCSEDESRYPEEKKHSRHKNKKVCL